MKQIEGFRFRRQHPIGDFIADFACVEAHLVIELDGSQHMENAVFDADRTRDLESRGYRVLRFWNNDVTENIAGVKERILEALRDYPHPDLPPERGKG
jgi:very-short-patch-repair endonuclease